LSAVVGGTQALHDVDAGGTPALQIAIDIQKKSVSLQLVIIAIERWN
jgi:hypothetical protein